MKNNYEIRGDHAAVFVKKGNGYIEALVDVEDIEKIDNAIKGTWSLDSNGYINHHKRQGRGNILTIIMHRVITNCEQGKEVDHINGCRNDNRKSNLRVVTHNQNMQNLKPYRNGTSGFLNLCWEKRRGMWRVSIVKDKKYKHVGYYKNKDEAIMVAVFSRGIIKPMSQEAALLQECGFNAYNTV